MTKKAQLVLQNKRLDKLLYILDDKKQKNKIIRMIERLKNDKQYYDKWGFRPDDLADTIVKLYGHVFDRALKRL